MKRPTESRHEAGAGPIAGHASATRISPPHVAHATALLAAVVILGSSDHIRTAELAPIDLASRPWKRWHPGAPAPERSCGPQLAPSDWFMRQRAYPYEAVPEDLRRRALADAALFASIGRDARSAPWTLAGPTNIGGRVTDLAVSPSAPGTIFMGTAAGGVFRSTNGGAAWSPVTDALPSLSIGALAVDPVDPSIVYVGTGEANAAGDTYAGSGVYRSTDGGDTWASVGLEATAKIGRILIDPTDPDRIFVAAMGRLYGTNPERGVYRSIDGGDTWDRVLYVNDSTGVVDIVINPSDPDQLFAAAWERIRRPYARAVGGPGSGIYTSIDGGDTWTLLGAASGLPGPSPTGGRIGLSLCAADPSVAYAIYANDPGQFVGVYKTTDGGTSWGRVDQGFPGSIFGGFGWYFGQIRVDPTNPDVVFALGVRLYRSTNGGVSWTNEGSGVHVDQHAMLIDPANPARVLLGNDGGFYSSKNSGTGGSWTKAPSLPISQFYAITVDAQRPWRIYGGTQDNSTVRTLTGSTGDWEIIYGGDGFYTLVDPTNSDVIYAEFQFGGLAKSINGGQSWVGALNGVVTSDRRNWSTPVVMDPTSPAVLYYGTYRVYRTTDSAGFWSPISNDLSDGPGPGNLPFGTITTIDVAPTAPDHVLAGTDDGNVWITTDGGAEWTHLSSALPDRWVTRVAFDPGDETVAYVTLSGYRRDEPLPHIFRTGDTGQSWQDISANLPSVPLNDVLVDPIDGQRLYVAADAGVYWSANGGAIWQPLGAGMPSTAVHDIHLVPSTRALVAGTHGRSAYTLDLDAAVSVVDVPPVFQPLVSVAPNPTSRAATFEVHVVIEGRVTVELFDSSGRLVRRLADAYRDTGVHEFSWDGTDSQGRDVGTSVYFYRVRTQAGPVVGRVVVKR